MTRAEKKEEHINTQEQEHKQVPAQSEEPETKQEYKDESPTIPTIGIQPTTVTVPEPDTQPIAAPKNAPPKLPPRGPPPPKDPPSGPKEPPKAPPKAPPTKKVESSGDLLSELITKGSKGLKKVEVLPELSKVKDTDSLAGALAKALEARRTILKEEQDEEEDNKDWD